MMNHKILYKVILVVGLLLTMILTLSLTQFSIAYAEDSPPIAETGNSTDEAGGRFTFDADLLEKARSVIGSDSQLSDTQLDELHQLGFNEPQIQLLIEIVRGEHTENTEIAPPGSQFDTLLIFLFFILLAGVIFIRKKSLFSKLYKFRSS